MLSGIGTRFGVAVTVGASCGGLGGVGSGVLVTAGALVAVDVRADTDEHGVDEPSTVLVTTATVSTGEGVSSAAVAVAVATMLGVATGDGVSVVIAPGSHTSAAANAA